MICRVCQVDPKDRAKMEMRDWLNNTVETLSTQVDEFEFEMEGLNGAMKKNKVWSRFFLFEVDTQYAKACLTLTAYL